ncbi:Uncharacterised protein [Paucimonas lemoignei]|nr:Uncharacterised protein [Paucimonas lemoignei]
MSVFWFELRQVFINPRKIAGLALVCWLVSLGLVALGDTGHEVGGLYVLLFGWLSLPQDNVAWLANAFFLIALFWVFIGVPSHICSVLALLLSLDTWNINQVSLNEHKQFVFYGFGWGAVLWFLALALVLAASGATSSGDESDEASSPTLRNLGLLLAAAVLLVSAGLALNDRSLANTVERKKLQSYAFKRGPVCQAEVVVITAPIRRLGGPVELVDATISAFQGPLSSVRSLLDWGIPAIQLAGTEYRLERFGNEKIMVSWPAKSQPGAFLYVSRDAHGRQVKLHDADGRQVFDQIWRKDADGTTCPEYSEYSLPRQQPREIVMAGLGLSGQMSVPSGSQDSVKEVELAGEVIEVVDDGTPAGATKNLRCPATIGWALPDKQGRGDDAFRVGSKKYYISRRDENALCHGDSAFLYRSYTNDKHQGIVVEKRQLVGFKQSWRTRVTLDTVLSDNAWKRLQPVDVEESSGKIRLVLASPDDGKRWVIEAKR